MSIVTKRLQVEKGNPVVVYEVSHVKEGRCLEQDLTSVFSGDGTVRLSLAVTECDAPNFEAGLDRMADWLERLALTLRDRGAADLHLPLYASGRPHLGVLKPTEDQDK